MTILKITQEYIYPNQSHTENISTSKYGKCSPKKDLERFKDLTGFALLGREAEKFNKG